MKDPFEVSAVVPAHNNQDSIAETIRSLATLSQVAEIIVVDDGSSDQTARIAEAAGARVVRLMRNLGKGAALERGFREARFDTLLMVDGDTGLTASQVGLLLEPLIAGIADMAVGVLPPAGRAGGFGLVRTLAAWLIRRRSGFRSRAPLSGQRALTRRVYEACSPLGRGFSVDSLLTAEAALLGFRIVEQEVLITHLHRGRSLIGFSHRARQGVDLVAGFLFRSGRG